MILPFLVAIERLFLSSWYQKNLQNWKIGEANSSAIQNISVTVSSVVIANFICNPLSFNTIKVSHFSLLTSFLRTYNLSDSCYFSIKISTILEYIKKNWYFCSRKVLRGTPYMSFQDIRCGIIYTNNYGLQI